MDPDNQESHAFSCRDDRFLKPYEGVTSWANTFCGVLTDPVATFNLLAANFGDVRFQVIIGALVIVLLAGLAGIVSVELGSKQSFLLLVLGLCVGSLFNWLALALMLMLLGRCLKIESTFSSALAVTGWAFTPFIFQGIIVCYAFALQGLGQLFFALLYLWFFALELIAYDSILKVGKVKSVSIILLLPPILFIALIFWSCFWVVSGGGP